MSLGKASGTVALNGDALLHARKRAGLSRERLATLSRGELVVSVATIKRAEKGRRVHLETARALASLLDCPMQDLLADPSDAEPPRTPVPAVHRISGRRQELARLGDLLKRARAGQPSLVLLSGEPGIGKTRVVRELCDSFRSVGGRFGVGQGYEHSGFAFQPFVEALSCLDVAGLGLEKADVARLRAWLDPASAEDSDPSDEQARFALFRTVFRALAAAARRHPLLLVVDDFQWIDSGSIALFQHLAFAAGQASWQGEGCGLVLLASHRRAESESRTAEALERLATESIAHRFELAGLNLVESFDLLAQGEAASPSQALVGTLHAATGGNPFFMQEAMRLLRLGRPDDEDPLWTQQLSAVDLDLPTTATAAVQQRVEALGAECRTALMHGACLGVRFGLDDLAELTQSDAAALLDPLEDAADDALIVSRGQHYEFRHPIVHHVVYRGCTTAFRRRTHAKIIDLLARTSGNSHIMQTIAEHVLKAGALVEPGRALRHTRMAADQAFGQSAWAEAGKFFAAAALAATRCGSEHSLEAASLHHLAATALHKQWDLELAAEHYNRAYQAFCDADSPEDSIEVLNDVVRLALNRMSDVDIAPLEEAFNALPGEQLALRSRTADTLAYYYMSRDPRRASELAAYALHCAKQSGNARLCSRVSGAAAQSQAVLMEIRRALDIWREGREFARTARDRLNEARSMQRIPIMLLSLGELEEAHEEAGRAQVLNNQVPNIGESALTLSTLCALALVRGELETALQLGEEALVMIKRSGYLEALPFVAPAMVQSYLERGLWDEARRVADQSTQLFGNSPVGARMAHRHVALIDTWQYGHKAATGHALLASSSEESPMNLRVVATLCMEIEIAEGLASTRCVKGNYDRLAEARERGIRTTGTWVYVVPRMLGVAAHLLCDDERAECHFSEALDLAEQCGATAETARSQLGLARVLHGRDRQRASGLLRAARSTLASRGMDGRAKRAAGNSR